MTTPKFNQKFSLGLELSNIDQSKVDILKFNSFFKTYIEENMAPAGHPVRNELVPYDASFDEKWFALSMYARTLTKTYTSGKVVIFMNSAIRIWYAENIGDMLKNPNQN